MNVNTSRRPTTAGLRAPAVAKEQEVPKEQPPEEKPPKQSTDGLNLPPNARHFWDEDKAKWVRRLKNVAVPLMFRREYSGMENIPADDKSYIVGPTHQSMFDAVFAADIPGNRPFGSMAAIEEFGGPIGKMLRDYGTFPVDRYGEYEGDFPHPVEHSVEIINEGKPFVFYPEGRIYADKQVYPLKSGIGRIAMNSTADYTVPVAKHFAKDDKFRWGETIVGGLLTAAAGAGVYFGLAGNPGVMGAIGGVVAGAAIGGLGGYLTGPKDDNARLALGSVIGAVGGAIGGGTLGATLAPTYMPAHLIAPVAAGLTGVAGLGATYHWTHRPVAHMQVGKPIAVAPFRERAAASDDPNAVWKEGLKLTADHHTAMAEAKFNITGEEQRFKMDQDGNEWGLQPDGNWVRVERNDDKEWVPIGDSGEKPQA